MTTETSSVDTAAKALDDFANGPAQDAANALSSAFDMAGDRIAASLEQAAKSGELSFNSLAESLTRDFAKLAIDQLITAPLEGLVGSIGNSISGAISGQRAPVTVNVSMASQVANTGPQASNSQMAARIAQAVNHAQSRG